ncbi:MAG: GIY-YIG nuclease family protein [Deltaproteobacteria bacterium]|nr:GIY-YIG nuclease family protein [Deltaproteobacteria bacterium]
MTRLINHSQCLTWIVYILRCADGTLYTGATNRLEKRLTDHNRGKASKYTRSRRPVILVAASREMSRSEALILESRIKKMPKEEKIAGLQKAGTDPKGHNGTP